MRGEADGVIRTLLAEDLAARTAVMLPSKDTKLVPAPAAIRHFGVFLPLHPDDLFFQRSL